MMPFTGVICSMLLLLGQAPAPAPPQALIGFRLAVESFIHGTGRVHDLDQILPRSHARIVRRLGCEHFECRADAERDLAGLDMIGFRAVVWGRWSTDAEIANRCDRLMNYLVCPSCDGTDRCPDRIDEMGWCNECK
jgi:hypothetical protein